MYTEEPNMEAGWFERSVDSTALLNLITRPSSSSDQREYFNIAWKLRLDVSCLVAGVWFAGRKTNVTVGAMRASLDRPIIFWEGMYAMCPRPVKGTMYSLP